MHHRPGLSAEPGRLYERGAAGAAPNGEGQCPGISQRLHSVYRRRDGFLRFHHRSPGHGPMADSKWRRGNQSADRVPLSDHGGECHLLRPSAAAVSGQSAATTICPGPVFCFKRSSFWMAHPFPWSPTPPIPPPPDYMALPCSAIRPTEFWRLPAVTPETGAALPG